MARRFAVVEGDFEPSTHTLSDIARRVGFAAYSPDFVRDIRAYMMGGQRYKELSDADSELADWIESQFSQMKECWKNRSLSGSVLSNVMTELAHQRRQSSSYYYPIQTKGSGETVPVFIDYDVQSGQSRQSSDELTNVQGSSVQGSSSIDGEGSADADTDSGGDDGLSYEQAMGLQQARGLKAGVGDEINKVASRVFLQEIRVDEAYEIARMLNKRARFRTKKSAIFSEFKDGSEILRRPIKNPGELRNLTGQGFAMRELANNLFNYKLASHGLTVKPKAAPAGDKQLLGLMIDVSGSMESAAYGDYRQYNNLTVAYGILLNRLEAVKRGEAELHVAMFSTKIQKQFHADSPESANELLVEFARNLYTGNGTNIQECLFSFIDDLDSKYEKSSVKPDIAIVTDGQDSVEVDECVDRLKRSSFTFHTLMVGEHQNKNLIEIARRTGGIGVENIQGNRK